MKGLVFSLFGLSILALTAGSARADAPPESIEGIWELSFMIKEDLPPMKVKVVITKETITFGALKFLDARIKTDPTKSPKEIDLFPLEGPKKDERIPCIYRLEGDRLQICYGGLDGTRPTGFPARSTDMVVLTMKRWR